jgi:uncharacterized membrane protein
VLLVAMLHGAVGSADELALMGLSVVIGVALAYFLGMSKKKS